MRIDAVSNLCSGWIVTHKVHFYMLYHVIIYPPAPAAQGGRAREKELLLLLLLFLSNSSSRGSAGREAVQKYIVEREIQKGR